MDSAKQRLEEVLRSTDWPAALQRLGEGVSRATVSKAVAALCSQEPIFRWRAVEAVGFLVSGLAQRDHEAARDVIRRLLWSLNEESGSIGWGAPEAIADIMARDQRLREEFLPIFVSFFEAGRFSRMHPAVAQGFLWGLFRLAGVCRPALLEKELETRLSGFLDSPEPATRGMAALALRRLGPGQSAPGLGKLAHDQEVFTFMEGGELYRISVCEAAQGSFP
jgi:HEAT repeat protein